MSTNATVRKRHRSTESSRLTTPRFLARLEAAGGALPAFVKQEFDDYLKCGLLEHVFLRVKCDACSHEHLVALSCNRRLRRQDRGGDTHPAFRLCTQPQHSLQPCSPGSLAFRSTRRPAVRPINAISWKNSAAKSPDPPSRTNGWRVCSQQQTPRAGCAETRARGENQRQAPRTHDLDAALEESLRHRYRNLPQVRRQARDDRFHRGFRRHRHHSRALSNSRSGSAVTAASPASACEPPSAHKPAQAVLEHRLPPSCDRIAKSSVAHP